MKKPRRSETNFLPDHPQGKDRKSVEEERKQIVQEMKKRNPDFAFVDAGMSSTYSLRRQEIVEDEPPVSEVKVRWPALFTERQVPFFVYYYFKYKCLDCKEILYSILYIILTELFTIYSS